MEKKNLTAKPVTFSQARPQAEPSKGILGSIGSFVSEQVRSRIDADFALGVANAIGQGVTFGTADEAIAGLASLIGKDYTEVRDAIRQNLDDFRESDPAFAYGAEIASSLLTPAGAARAATSLGMKAIANTAKSAAIKNPLKTAGLAGAAYGAGAAEEMEDVPASTITGGVLSVGGQALAPVAGLLPKGLKKAGIPVTAGQMFGSGTKRFEEAMQSFPVIGTGIRQARERAMEAFSPYIFNKALEPINVKLPLTLTPRESFNRARKAFNKKYEETLSDVNINMSDDVLDDLNDAVATAKLELGEAQKAAGVDLEDFVIREVLSAAKDGSFSGEALKNVQSKIFKKTLQAQKAGNYNLAEAFDEVDASLINIFAKYSSPDKAQALKNLDKAYSNYIPLRRAAAQADGSVITPARALQAVRAEERRAGATGLGRLAAGEARMQIPIEKAKSVIGAELSDSGTSERLGSMLLPLAATTGIGALGGLATGQTELGTIAGTGLGLTGLMGGRAAYTPLGQLALRNIGIPLASGALRSPATAGLLAQPTGQVAQPYLLGE